MHTCCLLCRIIHDRSLATVADCLSCQQLLPTSAGAPQQDHSTFATASAPSFLLAPPYCAPPHRRRSLPEGPKGLHSRNVVVHPLLPRGVHPGIVPPSSAARPRSPAALLGLRPRPVVLHRGAPAVHDLDLRLSRRGRSRRECRIAAAVSSQNCAPTQHSARDTGFLSQQAASQRAAQAARLSGTTHLRPVARERLCVLDGFHHVHAG